MEAAVEILPDQSSLDTVKLTEVGSKTPPIQEDANCQSNGVAESNNAVHSKLDSDNLPAKNLDTEEDVSTVIPVAETIPDMECNVDTTQILDENMPVESKSVSSEPTVTVSAKADVLECPINDSNMSVDVDKPPETLSSLATTDANLQINNSHNNVQNEEIFVDIPISESLGNESVRFETEVVVETNDNEVDESEPREIDEHDTTHNIMNEMNQNIELSEALCSSDVTDNVENNNCSNGQEMFNKEELLEILEGNDVSCSEQQEEEILPMHRNTQETVLALQQLSRLKQSKRTRKSDKFVVTPLKKKIKVKKIVETEEKQEEIKEKIIVSKVKKVVENEEVKEKSTVTKGKKVVENEQRKEDIKEESIVNVLVRDWEDDELDDAEQSIEKDVLPITPTEQSSENANNSIIDNEKRSSVDSLTNEGQTSALNKSGDDGQPQRRLGRVIKKKVIFDPDNPDTFTKGKTYIKNKDPQIDKDQPPSKKGKVEVITHRAKSKSPVSKMQWKKPSSKNSKQVKRLSEVDKLLMDEGAVNMIYQLTPEALKGKKNMRTKAEFIKKIQSSTPESKEMKFRERKKESIKCEDGEPKKILSGKQRSSLSSSVKSPSVCEDFENHSADDSIIYRRHSSSSYSSSCMSPRRLSDVEASINQSANVAQHNHDMRSQHESYAAGENSQHNISANEIINKDNCLTIKKKLNSKLSLALNKRKRDNIKIEKPPKKQPKLEVSGEESNANNDYKYLSLIFDQRVAEICIKKTTTKYSVEVLKEIIEALAYADLKTDTFVTLLTSECGTMCSELDLSPLLNDDLDERTKTANEIAEAVRSLLWAVGQHSKLTCVCAGGACGGLALALLALADVALAREGATFALRPEALTPGIAALVASYRQLPHALVNDLVIFGRQLSSSEALHGGLVSRVLCSAGYPAQLHSVAGDIANQPLETLLLKKKLLGLRKTSEAEFLSQLETERVSMVQYWNSTAGQEAIRAANQQA